MHTDIKSQWQTMSNLKKVYCHPMELENGVKVTKTRVKNIMQSLNIMAFKEYLITWENAHNERERQ